MANHRAGEWGDHPQHLHPLEPFTPRGTGRRFVAPDPWTTSWPLPTENGPRKWPFWDVALSGERAIFLQWAGWASIRLIRRSPFLADVFDTCVTACAPARKNV
jgi:hypothetical protein